MILILHAKYKDLRSIAVEYVFSKLFFITFLSKITHDKKQIKTFKKFQPQIFKHLKINSIYTTSYVFTENLQTHFFPMFFF